MDTAPQPTAPSDTTGRPEPPDVVARERRHTPPGPLPTFRTPVRGYAFAPRPTAAEDPSPGQLAILAREPANPADPLAVAVWIDDGTDRWRIGYLDRGVSARVAPRLDRGHTIEARIDGWAVEPDGRWRRPVLVLLPQPPPVVATNDANDRGGFERVSPAAERSTEARTPSGQVWGRPPGVTRRRVPNDPHRRPR